MRLDEMKTHWLNTVPEVDSSSRDSEGTNKIKGTVNRFTKITTICYYVEC